MCSDNFGSMWDPFGTHQTTATRRARRLRHGNPPIGKDALDPEVQAEIEAEQAAQQQTAMRRVRRQTNALFGAGSSVLGSPAKTQATGATAMGRGTSAYTGGRDRLGLGGR